MFVLGQVYDRELGDPARAIETDSRLLDVDPDDVEAMQALDRLYIQTARWYDLLSILERQAEHQSDDAGSDHRHAAGDFLQLENAVAIDNGGIVKWDIAGA